MNSPIPNLYGLGRTVRQLKLLWGSCFDRTFLAWQIHSKVGIALFLKVNSMCSCAIEGASASLGIHLGYFFLLEAYGKSCKVASKQHPGTTTRLICNLLKIHIRAYIISHIYIYMYIYVYIDSDLKFAKKLWLFVKFGSCFSLATHRLRRLQSAARNRRELAAEMNFSSILETRSEFQQVQKKNYQTFRNTKTCFLR